MFSIRGDVAPAIRLDRFNFVHFVFSKADGGEAARAEREADNNQHRQRRNHDPPETAIRAQLWSKLRR